MPHRFTAYFGPLNDDDDNDDDDDDDFNANDVVILTFAFCVISVSRDGIMGGTTSKRLALTVDFMFVNCIQLQEETG